MDKKLTPQEKFEKTSCRRINLKLVKKTDADILAWLEDQPSMQGAIRRLIREEIAREKEKCAK